MNAINFVAAGDFGYADHKSPRSDGGCTGRAAQPLLLIVLAGWRIGHKKPGFSGQIRTGYLNKIIRPLRIGEASSLKLGGDCCRKCG